MKVTLLNSMGSDITVANAARVSFAMESEEFGSRDKKLIRYLAAHGIGHRSHTYSFNLGLKRRCSWLDNCIRVL